MTVAAPTGAGAGPTAASSAPASESDTSTLRFETAAAAGRGWTVRSSSSSAAAAAAGCARALTLEDPVLDGVRDVRDDLDGLPKVVATALRLDDAAVHLARRDVVVAGQGHVEEALVVAQVKVGLEVKERRGGFQRCGAATTETRESGGPTSPPSFKTKTSPCWRGQGTEEQGKYTTSSKLARPAPTRR